MFIGNIYYYHLKKRKTKNKKKEPSPHFFNFFRYNILYMSNKESLMKKGQEWSDENGTNIKAVIESDKQM